MSVNTAAIAILLISFLVMILLRFPIAYAVALSSIFCLLYQGLPLTTVCQQMVTRPPLASHSMARSTTPS